MQFTMFTEEASDFANVLDTHHCHISREKIHEYTFLETDDLHFAKLSALQNRI